MDKEYKKFINIVCQKQSDSLVGKLCKRVEVFQKEPSVSSETKNILSIFKACIKEVMYEEMRELKYKLLFNAEGREYTKYPIYEPTEDGK
ncbi:hypothetical protein LCGC14_2356440 [marine sediment metagenome]|uniref:Uncharacterized protein n=1 Tax=marine sediment metagenome TaxID=412755 RepID=A0A0F9C7K8_9ZZZZ